MITNAHACMMNIIMTVVFEINMIIVLKIELNIVIHNRYTPFTCFDLVVSFAVFFTANFYSFLQGHQVVMHSRDAIMPWIREVIF